MTYSIWNTFCSLTPLNSSRHVYQGGHLKCSLAAVNAVGACIYSQNVRQLANNTGDLGPTQSNNYTRDFAIAGTFLLLLHKINLKPMALYMLEKKTILLRLLHVTFSVTSYYLNNANLSISPYMPCRQKKAIEVSLRNANTPCYISTGHCCWAELHGPFSFWNKPTSFRLTNVIFVNKHGGI